jgi:aquaporin Z
MSDLARKLVAELVGTFILVFFGFGSAVFGIDVIGEIGVGSAFGFLLLALAYAIGPVSGFHINPAVTLGVLLRRGITSAEAGAYWAAQVVGAILAAALINAMTGFGNVEDRTGGLGTNNWGEAISASGAFVLEVVIRSCSSCRPACYRRSAAPGFAGLAIGLVLIAIHMVAISLDGCGVKPARSLGPALFNGGEPLQHVWLFIVAPLIGGARLQPWWRRSSRQRLKRWPRPSAKRSRGTPQAPMCHTPTTAVVRNSVRPLQSGTPNQRS